MVSSPHIDLRSPLHCKNTAVGGYLDSLRNSECQRSVRLINASVYLPFAQQLLSFLHGRSLGSSRSHEPRVHQLKLRDPAKSSSGPQRTRNPTCDAPAAVSRYVLGSVSRTDSDLLLQRCHTPTNIHWARGMKIDIRKSSTKFPPTSHWHRQASSS